MPVHLLAGALGIAIMSAVAQFISWFEPLATGARPRAAVSAQRSSPDAAQRNPERPIPDFRSNPDGTPQKLVDVSRLSALG